MRRVSLVACGWSLILASACDLTLTQERPTYDQLRDYEKAAVDRIFAQAQAFDARLRAVSPGIIGHEASLGPPAEDHDSIDVSFEGVWTATNLGDDLFHVSVWENLDGDQRREWARWFDEDLDAAEARYERFFYDFAAVHLAAVQAVFRIQTVEYVYGHRTVFNVERDAQRLAVPYLRGADRDLFDWVHGVCGVILSRFEARWGDHYDQDFYVANLR